MTVLDRLKKVLSIIEWRHTERWLTIVYLGFQLVLTFVDPLSSIAMGVFLIAVFISATSF